MSHRFLGGGEREIGREWLSRDWPTTHHALAYLIKEHECCEPSWSVLFKRSSNSLRAFLSLNQNLNKCNPSISELHAYRVQTTPFKFGLLEFAMVSQPTHFVKRFPSGNDCRIWKQLCWFHFLVFKALNQLLLNKRYTR